MRRTSEARLWLTFIIGQLANDPGWLVSVEVDLQDVAEPLRVQIAPGSDHVCWRQAALPPGDVGHDVHWDQMGGETGSKTHNIRKETDTDDFFIDACQRQTWALSPEPIKAYCQRSAVIQDTEEDWLNTCQCNYHQDQRHCRKERVWGIIL